MKRKKKKKNKRLAIRRKIRQLWCLRRQVFQRIENSSMSNVVLKFQRLLLKTKINAKILHKFLNKGLIKKIKYINSRAV